ncbi:DUF3300 domain-containing protein [Alteromonas sp. ASW11-19]|uniref:DUF3300 domain-containing protein n=1 Tax=Alteromonas salexigens TaxID=2982530 RepID=A0ABT2VQM4_9ALTE|nr:DUF3300 domain-containing protein [Alteromonas salexigens]MCU7554743.1 DUF3300 domain-containing protein [Alteromonas salexigens]
MKQSTLPLIISLAFSSLFPVANVQATPEPLPQMAESSYSDAELDSLLAPIALYPDTVLTHILIASTYPLEVVAADRWRQENAHLNAEQVANAVEAYDWDPSVKALAPFDQVLRTMADDLNWLQSLGDNVLISQSRVLARVQVLRQHALSQGALSDNEYQRVERDAEVIVIEPRRREVVYVPYYDTRVVYGHWWHPVAPVHWHHPVNYRNHFGFYWSPSIRLTSFFYFGGIHWHNRHVVVTHRPVRHYHHGYSRKRVYSKEYQRWNHNVKHRRIRYSDRVVRSAPERYAVAPQRKVVHSQSKSRQVDYRQQPRQRLQDARKNHRQVTPVKPKQVRTHAPEKSRAPKYTREPVRHSNERDVVKPRVSKPEVVRRPNQAAPRTQPKSPRQYTKPVERPTYRSEAKRTHKPAVRQQRQSTHKVKRDVASHSRRAER